MRLVIVLHLIVSQKDQPKEDLKDEAIESISKTLTGYFALLPYLGSIIFQASRSFIGQDCHDIWCISTKFNRVIEVCQRPTRKIFF